MLTTEHKVYYNKGDQTLVTVPIDREGRPTYVSSATYAIFDRTKDTSDSDRTIQASAAATVDSTSTTSDAAAGPGTNARQISVSDASGFAEGKYYIIEEADGRRELFRLRGVDTTNDNLYLVHGLSRDFSSGATVRGLELSATFPTAEANDETHLTDGGEGGPYQLVWTWTLNGVAENVTEHVWITREPFPLRVVPEDLLNRSPGLNERVGDRMALEPLIVAAKQDLLARLQAQGLDPDYYRSAAMESAIVYRALWYVHMQYPSEHDDELARAFREEWEFHLSSLTHGRQPTHTVKTDVEDDTSPEGSNKDYHYPIQLS